jgi:hypothetical protein
VCQWFLISLSVLPGNFPAMIDHLYVEDKITLSQSFPSYSYAFNFPVKRKNIYLISSHVCERSVMLWRKFRWSCIHFESNGSLLISKFFMHLNDQIILFIREIATLHVRPEIVHPS